MLDLRGISSFTDFFVICSGTSEPQLKAISNEIETRLREDYSLRPVAVDGFPASQWMVLDYLQVVVHIFHRDKRAFYSLEGLWGDAPVLQWESVLKPLDKESAPQATRRFDECASDGEPDGSGHADEHSRSARRGVTRST